MTSPVEQFQKLIDLPNLLARPKSVVVADIMKIVLQQRGERVTLHLLSYDRDENIYKDRYKQLKTVVFPSGLPLDTIIDRRFKLRGYGQVNAILKLADRKIKSIIIENDRDGMSVQNRILKISQRQFLEVMQDAEKSYNKGKKQSGYVTRYYNRLYSSKHLGTEYVPLTLVGKNDFNFLIERLNLPSKSKKKDFQKYLSDHDLKALANLCDSLIRNEVFDPAFLRRLNDFFVKDKLAEIVALGRRILELGTTDLTTDKAKSVICDLTGAEGGIGQLESVWQKYFEDNLLFLIFSYIKIFPKVTLDIDAEKKYPDFIGVNHYGGVDVIEIKTHLKNALVYDSSHGNFAFSSELSRAIIQTVNYMDGLVTDKISNRSTSDAVKAAVFRENLHRPRGIIVISSKSKLVPQISKFDIKDIDRDFTKLRNAINLIEIITFDEILDIADRYISNIEA